MVAITPLSVPLPVQAPDPPEGASVAGAFLAAMTTADAEALRGVLALDVRLRALLPRTVVEHHGRDPVAQALAGWMSSHRPADVLDTSHHRVGGRHHVRYRIALWPPWEPAVRHVIEQAGYVKIVEGRIVRIDVVCSGYHPEP